MLLQLRILAGALMGALLVIGVALYLVLSATSDVGELPPLWVVGAQIAAGGSMHYLLEATGYRTTAIPPGTPRQDAEPRALVAFQSALIRRFAFSEFIAMASVVVAFVIHQGQFLAYVSGAFVSLALMIVHVVPWARPIARTAASLDRDGGRSYLLEALGLPGPEAGPIQRL
jgi:hypothetical protein